jgi:DNA-binding transcriptional LysR family regulator
MNYFNPRHLQAFVAAIETGSMVKAARQLHMGQPAFSQAITNLETIAGVKLMTRTTRSLQLTPAGVVFLRDAQRVLDMNKRLLHNTRHWANGQHGSVSVLSIPSVAHLLLPTVVKSYGNLYPEVDIQVHDHPDPQLRLLMQSGEGDFAIFSKAQNGENFKNLSILKDRLRWVGSSEAPLSQRPQIRLKDLQRQQFIVMRRGAIRDMVNPLLEKIQSPVPLIEVDQQSTLVGMIAAGMGMTFLPSLSCQSWTHTQTTHRALDFGDFHRAIQISRATARDLMPCTRAFLRLFISTLQAGHFQLQEGVELLPLSDPEVEKFLT